MRYLVLIATLVGWLVSAMEIKAYYLDTPHNESNGIVCYTCHGMAGLTAPDADANGVPDWTWADRALADPEDTAHNFICNSCHSSTPTPGLPKGPEKVLHSKKTTGSTKAYWTTECVQCHDVHYQGQLDYSADDYAKLYLVTGTFTSNAIYSNPTPLVAGSDSTSINFTTTTVQAGFEDTSKWKSKGGSTSGSANMVAGRAVDGSRGLILVPDKTNHPETFEIINVTANTIKVKGQMVRDAISSGNFAIIYGQSIKSSVMPNGGVVANDLRDVKYYTPKLINSSFGGHVDLTTGSTKPLGLCQVCHTTPSSWPKSGGPATHYPATDCDSCHNILTGGGAPVVANTGGPYLVEQGAGVTLMGGADFATPCIDGESTQWDLDNNGTYDVAGPGFVGGIVNLTWAQLGAYGLQTVGVPHTIRLQALNACSGMQATATTTLTVYENTPVANFTATPNPAACGQSIIFDGSTSSHTKPGRSIVSYVWNYGDGATGTGVTASHAYSGSGSHLATLTVTDNNLPAKTATTTVTVNVNQCNSAPVANAGTDQSVTTGALVTLNGSGSTDGDGDPLSYGWSFISRPVGSSAGLAGASTARPTFTADVAGSYVVSLVVNDGKVDSGADTVTVTAVTPNHIPVANAGPDQSVVIGVLVALNGSASTDVDGDPLSYGWSFTSRPGGSSAVLSGATTASPTFTADVAGSYVVSLVVNDGRVGSVADSLTITVLPNLEDIDLGFGSPVQQGGDGLVGEGVRIFNGNVIEARSDLALPSPNSFGLGLTAFYNSRSAQSGAMGYGWSHTYEVSLDTGFFLGTINVYRLVDQTGRVLYFTWDAGKQHYSGLWQEKSYIVSVGGDLVWCRRDGSRFGFGFDGKLSWIADGKGNRLDLSYNGNRLQAVTDQATGRVLNFVYNGNLLENVTGPITDAIPEDPAKPGFSLPWVTYQYDANSNLIAVLYADGDRNFTTPPFASGVRYSYTDTHDLHNLTARKDTLGNTLATWGYDNQDRCTANYSVNGTGAASIVYNPTSPVVSVTDAYGIVRGYTIDATKGRKRLAAMATSNGPAPYGGDIIRWVYDNNLNLIETESIGGVVNQYSGFDANGNPATAVLSVGALDQSGASLTHTIHYEYHPTISAVTRGWETSLVNSGGIRETIYDYDNPSTDPDPATPNSNPTNQVYKTTEKGYSKSLTGVATPYTQSTAYEYTALGQISRVDDPRTDVSDQTVYTYYPAAPYNLEKITKPVIGDTVYLDYDHDGRPRLIQDENGRITSTVVDGRGRAISITANYGTAEASVRTREYSGGQLKKETDQDGVATTYAYYATTGRLYRIYDLADNYQQNTYDAQGNLSETGKYAASDSIHPTYLRDYDYSGHPVIKGRLFRSIKSNNYYAEYDYYADGSEKSYRDYDGKVTSSSYDSLGRKVRTEYPTDPGHPTVANYLATAYDLYGEVAPEIRTVC